MPRRRQDQAVARRADQIPDAQAQRRREAAQRGAQTRRQRRERQEAGAQPQVRAGSPARGDVAPNRRPRAHGDMLTVAIRGPIAEKMRDMAERHGMSLARLLQDSLLVLEAQVTGGYELGTALTAWVEQQASADG